MGKMDHFHAPLTEAAALPLAPGAPAAFGRVRAAIRNRTLHARVGKRIVDLALVVSALPVALPLILVMALPVMRDGGKPFFGHRRMGRGGKSFSCWKLRSMVPDAAERLKDHLAANPAARAEWEATFKLKDDPRITRFGRFLRHSSIDELPQPWNILKGELSVVGPRPVTRTGLAQYGPCRARVFIAARRAVSPRGRWARPRPATLPHATASRVPALLSAMDRCLPGAAPPARAG